jgi:two-component system cell cycle response regulator DivK
MIFCHIGKQWGHKGLTIAERNEVMSERILVVEDNPMNAKFFEYLLKRKGNFEVIMTEDVDQILQMAKTQEIDLILMDISLGNSYYQGKEVDGTDITNLLKQDSETKNIPVILASAYTMKGDRERFLKETQADDYVAKPIVAPQELIDKINRLLGLRRTEH